MKTQYPLQAYTLLFDYLKHIATLSTGSILLIVAFLEKLFSKPEWRICIGISLVSFIITVVGTVFAQAIVVDLIEENQTISSMQARLFAIAMLSAWFFFLVGLISLVAFALKNFY